MCQPPKEPPVDAAAAIKELYARHDPDKLKEVDALLKKFAGREAQLLQAVTAKYCPDDVDRFARIGKFLRCNSSCMIHPNHSKQVVGLRVENRQPSRISNLTITR